MTTLRFVLVIFATTLAAALRADSSDDAALRGIVLLADAESFREAGLESPAPGIDPARVPWLEPVATRRALELLLGQRLDAATLSAVRIQLNETLRAQQHGFARVSIPPQQIAGGVLQVIVYRSRVGAVSVEGAKRWTPAAYTDALSLRQGDVLDQARLETDVDWINRNPFRTVGVRVQPGDELGTTDIVLQVEERRPWRVYGGFNNTGNDATDDKRVFAGFSWGTPFGRDDQLSYQFMSDPRADRLQSHSGSYTLSLPWRHLLTLSASYAKISAEMPAPLAQDGSSLSASLRYTVPLALRGPWAPRFSAGIDLKRSDNNILFAAIPITDNLTDIVQLFASWGVTRQDRAGFTDASLTLTGSPGGVSARNKDHAFGPSRAFAEAQYAYATFDLTRVTRLPREFAWRSNTRAQFSTGNLLGSEQLGFGGSAGPRGYEEGEVYADEGLLWINELRLPAFRAAHALGLRKVRDSLQPLVFVDAGWARVHTPLAGEPRTTNLLSTGIGFRYALGSGLDLNADYGWQLKDTGLNRRNNHRGHISATFAW